MRAILVERRLPREPSRLQELAELARTLGYEVVAVLQQMRKPDPAYHIGKGKAQELAKLVKSVKAERVIFGNQLTPSQAYKLSRLTGVEVMDRFQLILEIFAMRAGSPEAKLQIEYAKLNYELPRIKERIRMLRMVERPGLRGGGEYEIDVRRDMIKKRMIALRRKLVAVARSRAQRRKRRRRRGFNLIALAGYTNAGKSTLLNALTASNVEVDDMLFTTLTPKTRVAKTERRVLLTDTVGFIDGLPPWLVEAFKATLEEIYLADLVVLVVDGSEPLHELLRKLQASRQILAEYPVRVITVLNKIDLLSPAELDRRLRMIRSITPIVVPISATEGTNLGSLLGEIRANISKIGPYVG
jgi:GTP-binding protein HflX